MVTKAEQPGGEDQASPFEPYDLAPMAYCTMDGQGLVLEANLAVATLLGLPRKELVRQPIRRFIQEEDQKTYEEAHRELAATGKPITCDLRLTRGDGTPLWANVVIAGVEAATGAPIFHLVLSDITEKTRLEQAKAYLAKGEWLLTGESFFSALARFLAGHLGMDYICIDRLVGDTFSAETLAVWYDGRFEDNVVYTLKDTPCGDVVGKSICCFPAGVRHLFPKDQVLQDMGAESYLGVTLFGTGGQPIGLIALIGRHPVGDSRLAEGTLALVAARAAAELEHLQAEEALHEARQLHEQVLQGAHEGIIVHDRELKYRVWNPFMEQLSGLPASAVVGKHPIEVFPFLREVGVVARLERALNGEAVDSIDIQYQIASTGKTGWATDSVGPLRNGKGEIIGVIGMVRDISERKAAEETMRKLNEDLETRIQARTIELSRALETLQQEMDERQKAATAIRHSEEKYSTVVENSPTGIFIPNNAEILFANPRFFEILKRSPDELTAIHPYEIIHPDDLPGVQELWAKRLTGQEAPQDIELRILAGDGGLRWITGRSAVIPYGNGSALLVNIHDITERKEALEALKESQKALHGLSARMISIQENERQRVARELHDSIGSTLSAIKLMVERALDVPCPHEFDCHVQALRSVVPVIQDSVEEVRRISMALHPLTLDDLGLITTIDWFMREFQRRLPAVKIEQRIELTDAAIPDPLKTNIFRILQEGLNNAAKYSQARRVGVGLRAEEDQIILEMEDDGVGFDQATLRHPNAAGGFGLASMRERIELSGGELSILAAPGRGTRLRACWPAV
ncbi:MAG: PAS domain S-box protein [Holophaga sp.]